MEEHGITAIITDGVSRIPFARRVLLLPHCLRPSQGCSGQMTKQGLDCTGCVRGDCAIFQLRTAAIEVGYMATCVSPGGRLAAKFVAERAPAGVIAVACRKELEEGLDTARKTEWTEGMPAAALIPLLRDGCVDTEVDIAAAQVIIRTYAGDSQP